MPKLDKTNASSVFTSPMLSIGLAGVLGLGLGLFAAGCGSQSATPLSQDADILIDDLGIPHIYAHSDEDAMVASGYMMARLRLFQLETVRRQAWGRAAELLGESAYHGDLVSRAFDFPGHGVASRARVESEFPEQAKLMAAFVRGINLYIDKVRHGEAPLPPELAPGALDYVPEPFGVDDPYVIGKMLSFGMSSSLEQELFATALSTLAPALAGFPFGVPTRPAYTMPNASQIMPIAAPRTDGNTRREGPPMQDYRAAIAARLRTYQPTTSRTTGSNNWAVAGRFTENGRPLIAGDPHQPYGNPIRFYAQHISSAEHGGSLDVAGFSFTGTPGVQLGHNRRVAWTATTNFADVMDLWRVKLHGDTVTLGGGKTATVKARTETIRVRGASGPAATSDGTGEARSVTISDVPGYGVLLPEELLPVPRFVLLKGGEEVLFNWTGFGATREAAMYGGLDVAQDLDAFERAAERLEVGAVNLIFADSKNIRYRVHANVPRRDAVKQGIKPWMLLDGSDASTLWTGNFLGDAELPSSREPERGYLVTANNDPWGFTGDGRVDNDPFYYGYFYDPGDRAGRIETELRRLIRERPGKVTTADMQQLQFDVRSTVADDLLPPLFEAVKAIGIDPQLDPWKNRPELSALSARLEKWDRQMRRGSTEAALFFAVAHFMSKRSVGDELGPFFNRLLQLEPSFVYKAWRLSLRDVPGTTGVLQEGKRVLLVSALADAYDWAKQRFGVSNPESDSSFAWRDIHFAKFDHIMGGKWSAPWVPVDGSVGTVSPANSALVDGEGKLNERFATDEGPLFRMVVGWSADGQPEASINYPRGNDADPGSRFFENTHKDWQENRSKPLPFRRADVEAAAVERLTLSRQGQIR
jgi:penicillin amidase